MNYLNKFFICISKIMIIFAVELTMRTSFKVLIIAAFFIAVNQTAQGCCFSSGSRYLALLTFAKQFREQQSFFINLIFNPTMRTSIKNESSENNSNLRSTTPNGASSVSHETCEKLIAFIRERYPNLNQIKYKISKNGKHFAFRASYRQRRIHANGRDFEKTMNTFMFYLILKLSIDKYYPTVAELREKKPLEAFYVRFQCALFQNNIINN